MKDFIGTAQAAWVMAWKDLKTEFRRPHEILSIIIFSVGSVLIAGLVSGEDMPQENAVSVFWIVLFFVTILTNITSFTREADRGTLGGLKTLPCSPLAILGGKIMYGAVLVHIVGIVALFFSALFLHLNPRGDLAAFLLIYMIGATALSFSGSFISALVMFSEGSTFLLSFLLIPVSMPVLLPSAAATVQIVGGRGFWDIVPELQLLLAFCALIGAIMIFTFTEILEE